jgi:hypothetical protein
MHMFNYIGPHGPTCKEVNESRLRRSGRRSGGRVDGSQDAAGDPEAAESGAEVEVALGWIARWGEFWDPQRLTLVPTDPIEGV